MHRVIMSRLQRNLRWLPTDETLEPELRWRTDAEIAPGKEQVDTPPQPLYIQSLPYERLQDSDRPALEERRYHRHLPGDADLFRSALYHGHFAKIRRRGGSAYSGPSGTHSQGSDYSGFLSRHG